MSQSILSANTLDAIRALSEDPQNVVVSLCLLN